MRFTRGGSRWGAAVLVAVAVLWGSGCAAPGQQVPGQADSSGVPGKGSEMVTDVWTHENLRAEVVDVTEALAQELGVEFEFQSGRPWSREFFEEEMFPTSCGAGQGANFDVFLSATETGLTPEEVTAAAQTVAERFGLTPRPENDGPLIGPITAFYAAGTVEGRIFIVKRGKVDRVSFHFETPCSTHTTMSGAAADGVRKGGLPPYSESASPTPSETEESAEPEARSPYRLDY